MDLAHDVKKVHCILQHPKTHKDSLQIQIHVQFPKDIYCCFLFQGSLKDKGAERVIDDHCPFKRARNLLTEE